MRIALFIDAENLGADYFPSMMKVLTLHGNVMSRQAVGDFTRPSLAPWVELGRTNTLDLVLQTSPAGRKNGADIALASEAMSAALGGRFDAIAIASCDSDFAPLAIRIRRLGLETIGLGAVNHAAYLPQAFTRFEILKAPSERIAGAAPEPPAIVLKPKVQSFGPSGLSKTEIDFLRKLARELCSPKSGDVPLSSFGTALRARNADLSNRIGTGKLLRTLTAAGVVRSLGAGKATLVPPH